jgi:eukaryotic-like serine/threonine-protein kinase
MDLREQLESTLGTIFTFDRELGGGGMSRVFAAEETRLRRKVVVKVLSPELGAGVSAERFEREIQTVASLQQANIVPVLTVGETAGLPYYTMPYVEGESLRAHLAKRGALSIAEVVSIARDVAKALQYAHERGVVHRDIKPDNVLLSGGTAVVTDFGIAKAISAARVQADATLTHVGTSIGTPAYMAPEQAAGDPDIDQRADLYAFGCMTYELLAGRPPFADRTPQRMLAAHMGERPQLVTELRPDTPAPLADLVMKCLEKEADARPQTAAEMLRVLEGVTSGGTLPAMPPILLGGRGMLTKALALYALSFIVVAIVARAAIVAIGLPGWVFPGALVVMALGLPVILFTGYVHHVAHRAATATPTLTPRGTVVPSAPHGPMATLAVKASPHISWRRTWLGGAAAVGAFVLLIGGFMLLRAMGIGPAGSLFAAGKLSARDKLLVTDFRVRGADSALGAVISEAVRAQLGQSDVINILSPAAVAGTLRLMERPATTRVDLALAREVAQRSGAKAIVDGDVTPLGTGYVLTLRLVTADSGVELASYHETAEGPKDLLPTLDKLARKLRGRMGESLRTVQGAPPLEQVTTSSLEALKKYVEGARANDVEGEAARAVAALEEAVRIDTAFAEAWRKLGIAYLNGAMPREKQDSAFARAYRYRSRLTEFERMRTVADFFSSGPGRDRGRGIAAQEELVRRFPDRAGPYNNLALDVQGRREYASAESLFRRDVALDSSSTLSPSNLVRILLDLGAVDSAAAVAAWMQERFPHSFNVQTVAGVLSYAGGRADSMATLSRRFRTSPNRQLRVIGARNLATLALREGRLSTGVRNLADAAAEDAARGGAGTSLDDSVTVSMIDAWFETQPVRAVQRLDVTLARTPLRSLPVDDRAYFRIASVYAIARRPDRARAVLAQFDADVKDTVLRHWFEPDRHRALAEIALAERRPREAIDEFRRGDQRSDGPAERCPICVYAELGRAFDQAEMPDSAIVMFERYVSTPHWQRFELATDGLQLAAAYKRLGELYEGRGDRPKAASNYAKFVELWKDADPELQPKVREARARLARLSDTEKR